MDTQENADITNIPLTTSNTEPAIPAREIPEITRVAYLGPSGTFTSVAAQQLADEHTEFIPALDVPNTLRMVRHGEADYGIVPIENSVEGSVNATLDSLMHGELLEIKAETLVPIRFALAVRPGTTLDNITSIATHPHAWAQCRNWIATNIGEVQHIPTNSTAAGAQLLASEEEVAFEAALCPIATCRDLGLTSL
ncbi:MAG: prephenate dehydratase, partial [Actinomycetaceae bacterium]|nr:prephenate dehydratase [Actinomycetaceae bacterium]